MRLIATWQRPSVGRSSPTRTSPLAGSIVGIARRAPNHIERAPIEVSPLQAATAQILIGQLGQLRVDASRLPAPAPGRQDGACTGPKRLRHAAELNALGAPMDRRKRFPAAHREAPLYIGSRARRSPTPPSAAIREIEQRSFALAPGVEPSKADISECVIVERQQRAALTADLERPHEGGLAEVPICAILTRPISVGVLFAR